MLVGYHSVALVAVSVPPKKNDLLTVLGSDMGEETLRDERLSTKRAGYLRRCAYCVDVESPHDLFLSRVEVPRKVLVLKLMPEGCLRQIDSEVTGASSTT
jgi:hypothetical protein